MFIFIILMMISQSLSIGMDSLMDLLIEVGNRSSVVFHHPTVIPEEREGVLFYPASSDLSEYLAITRVDPYALVNISGDQMDTYSYMDGDIQLKYFKQPEGIHIDLGLEYIDLNTLNITGLHVILVFSDVSESKKYAEMVQNIKVNDTLVSKHCFDISKTSFNYDFVKLPAIVTVSKFGFIPLEEPIHKSYIEKVVNFISNDIIASEITSAAEVILAKSL
jgi:hypothetical protein